VNSEISFDVLKSMVNGLVPHFEVTEEFIGYNDILRELVRVGFVEERREIVYLTRHHEAERFHVYSGEQVVIPTGRMTGETTYNVSYHLTDKAPVDFIKLLIEQEKFAKESAEKDIDETPDYWEYYD
jgi:hypothetical protein